MLITVIIPVYNAENFLEATVNSVLAQTFNDFEIILVDDGSKDNSGNLCDRLALNHECIRVIHKPNGGVSSARNTGIESALGKYITFVDSDDSLDENMLADMVCEIEKHHADKVFCGHEEIASDGSSIIHIANLPPRSLLTWEDVVNKMLFTGCSGDSYMNSVCGGLFKTSILINNNLRFENRSMGEDWIFNMKYCDLIQSAVYIDQPYYKYLRNSESSTSRLHPHQFEYWIENRHFRQILEKKYQLSLDYKKIDSVWVMKVLLYALQVINQKARSISIHAMLRHEEVRKALKNAEYINIKSLKPLVWLLRHHRFRISETYLHLLAHHYKK